MRPRVDARGRGSGPGWTTGRRCPRSAGAVTSSAPSAVARPVPATARPTRRLPRDLGAPAALGLALLAGLVAGALTSPGQTLLGGTGFAGLSNAVSPWLVVPFLVGSLARRGWVAALVGVLVCAGQVAGYYLVSDLRGFGVSASSVAVWVVAGVVGGPLFGWAGRSWREAAAPGSRWRGAAVALVAGCWLAEAVVSYGIVLGYVADTVVFAVVALLTLLVLGRRGGQTRAALRWLPVTAALGAGGYALVHAVLG